MATVTGGDRLKAALAKFGAGIGNATSVKVGFLEGSQELDGTSSPMVAAIQEFGAPKKGIPPRPFFRAMISKHSGEWPAELAAILKEAKYDAAKSLDKMGSEIASELRQSIIDMNDPPLSPVTIMLRSMKNEYEGLPFYDKFKIAVARVQAGKSAKGASEKPLVDTRALLKNVDYIVK